MSFDPEAFKAAEIRVAAFNELTPEQGRALYCGYLKEKLIADGVTKQLSEAIERVRHIEEVLEYVRDALIPERAVAVINETLATRQAEQVSPQGERGEPVRKFHDKAPSRAEGGASALPPETTAEDAYTPERIDAPLSAIAYKPTAQDEHKCQENYLPVGGDDGCLACAAEATQDKCAHGLAKHECAEESSNEGEPK